MQNQKTKAAVRTDDLPLLTEQEEALVEAVAEGLNNSEAYKKAYNAIGYSPNALKVQACRKIAEPKIQLHLKAIRAVGLTNVRLTLEQRIESELAFAQRAEDAGNFGAAGGAYDRINKLMGLYVDKFENVNANPLDALNQIGEQFPELAKQLADEAGIAWERSGTTKPH